MQYKKKVVTMDISCKNIIIITVRCHYISLLVIAIVPGINGTAVVTSDQGEIDNNVIIILMCVVIFEVAY